MADIQADSITGLLSIGAFIVIFCTTSVALVTNACDLIHYIPDHGLDFLGGPAGGQHGKKMSDNFAGAAGGAVMAAVSSGAMDAQKSVKADVAARKKAASEAKAGGGGNKDGGKTD